MHQSQILYAHIKHYQLTDYYCCIALLQCPNCLCCVYTGHPTFEGGGGGEAEHGDGQSWVGPAELRSHRTGSGSFTVAGSGGRMGNSARNCHELPQVQTSIQPITFFFFFKKEDISVSPNTKCILSLLIYIFLAPLKDFFCTFQRTFTCVTGYYHLTDWHLNPINYHLVKYSMRRICLIL